MLYSAFSRVLFISRVKLNLLLKYNTFLSITRTHQKVIMEVNSGNNQLDSLVQQWLELDNKTSKSYSIVQSMVADKQWTDLEKIMLKRLKFGTAGIRGKMGPGFSQLNDLVIIQTSQGLAQYVLSSYPSPEEAREAGAVISFDARHNSSRWAKLTARVFLKAGFKVYLFNSITPTPFVPFTVQQKNAAVGIMVTASHNPKEDNGYKVFWSNGPQIKPPHDTLILKSILEHLQIDDPEAYNDDLYKFKEDLKIDPTKEMTDKYYQTLKDLLFDESLNEGFKRNIVYTAMHGVGAAFIDQAFAMAKFRPVVHVPEQQEPDPEFPTAAFPNPEEGKSALNLSMRKAEEVGSIYIIANDPDADRLAVAELVDGTWRIFNGNEIGAILAWWQLQVHLAKHGESGYKRENLYYIASTVSSKMLGALAKKEGLVFEETLTGFKWMANRAYDLEKASKDNKVLLAYEEAIGFMCGTQVLDKDGVSAAIRVAELLAFLDTKQLTFSQKLNEIYKEYGYHCNRASYFIITDNSVTTKIFHRLRNFSNAPNTYPQKLADGQINVESVRDLTTGYDNAQVDGKAVLPSDPSCQMITFNFDNGVIATLRTSGTEPKLKYYAEYCGKPEQTDWSSIETELDKLVHHLTEEFLQPKLNGLLPRTA